MRDPAAPTLVNTALVAEMAARHRYEGAPDLHPDHKIWVLVEYVGPTDREYTGLDIEKWPLDEEHELLYTDGYVALTLYECCYALWSPVTGESLGGALWKKSDYRLSKQACADILALVPETRTK